MFMKKRSLPVRTCGLAILSMAGLHYAFLMPAAGADNLASNAGFEEGSLKPWEWYVANGAEAEGQLDTAEKHGGTQSFRIHNASAQQPNVYGQLRQYITGLEPNTTYQFTAWVKGQDVTGALVAFGPEWKIIQAIPSGSFDWTEIKKEFTTGDATEKYEIVFISNSVTEALWIDDIEVTKGTGKSSARVYDPSTWPNLPAAARYYPIFPENKGGAEQPVVRVSAENEPSVSADVRMSHDAQSLFF